TLRVSQVRGVNLYSIASARPFSGIWASSARSSTMPQYGMSGGGPVDGPLPPEPPPCPPLLPKSSPPGSGGGGPPLLANTSSQFPGGPPRSKTMQASYSWLQLKQGAISRMG